MEAPVRIRLPVLSGVAFVGPPAEFSRIVKIDTLSHGKVELDCRATVAEAAALAARFGLVAVDRLVGCGQLVRHDTEFVFRGMLEADVVQTCVVSLEPFKASVRIPVERRYVKAGSRGDDEIGPEIDIIEQDEVDIGEMLAEELGLALDPYPRSEAATAITSATDGTADQRNENTNPFAKLRGL